MNEKETPKSRPYDSETLVNTLHQGREIDGRTNIAKAIKQCRNAVHDSLTSAAVALLEHDVSTAAVIQQLALKQAFSNHKNIVDSKGKPHAALNTWNKYGQYKRQSLMALKAFHLSKEPEDKPPNLGDIILETSDFETEDEDRAAEPKDRTAEPDDQF